MNIVTTDSITRRFGAFTAVDAVSLNIEQGETFGLLGPNGAGKTTLIKMLTTLLAPTSGEATVNGYSVTRQAAQVRRSIGYVPQLISSDSALSGYENLLVFAKLYDIPRDQRPERLKRALEFMGLGDAAHRLVKTYSGGMIRRLEIAQSILHEPPVLFLDEPTVGLDPIARKAVWERIDELKREFGTTILLTTHLMEEADGLCRRVAIMSLGRVAASGTPAEMKASVGKEGATLEDAFVFHTGDTLVSSGHFREVSRQRRVARRLG
jgi:ABC-2 type transport system ATP-binding protein